MARTRLSGEAPRRVRLFSGGARLLLALSLASAGCAGSTRSSEGAAAAPSPQEMPEEGPGFGGYAFDGSAEADLDVGARSDALGVTSAKGRPASLPQPAPPPAPDGQTPTDQSRAPLLIYDATLTLAVFETAQHIDAIEEMARAAGGYLVHRSERQITVRVPSDAFASSLERMAKDGDELGREVRVKDVTAEFTDLEIRLRNARAVRERLEALLAQATKVEEALAVERELERVTGEIELMLGRLKLLRELVHFSTITVRFEPRPVDQVQSRTSLPFPWLHELGLPHLLSL